MIKFFNSSIKGRVNYSQQKSLFNSQSVGDASRTMTRNYPVNLIQQNNSYNSFISLQALGFLKSKIGKVLKFFYR